MRAAAGTAAEADILAEGMAVAALTVAAEDFTGAARSTEAVHSAAGARQVRSVVRAEGHSVARGEGHSAARAADHLQTRG
jgi:hypothetical protein